MVAFWILAGVSLLISVLGIINMTGNISSLHSYHRHRVSEEDRKPFGRLVGLGTLLIGITVGVYGIFLWSFEKTQSDALMLIGTLVLLAGIAVGIVISLYAMIKYNKGIF